MKKVFFFLGLSVLFFPCILGCSSGDDPGDTSLTVTRLGQWERGFSLTEETEVFCHLYGKGTFLVQFRLKEKIIRRTLQSPVPDWSSFSRKIGPGTLEVLIEPVEEEKTPVSFSGCIITTNPDFVPNLLDFSQPLWLRVTNRGGEEEKVFVNGVCRDPSRVRFSLGFLTREGFLPSGILPSGQSTRPINLSRIVYGRTVLSFRFDTLSEKSELVFSFFRDRQGKEVLREFTEKNPRPFTRHFIFYPGKDNSFSIMTTEEVIYRAEKVVNETPLKGGTPSKILILADAADQGEKPEVFRKELDVLRKIGVNGLPFNLGQMDNLREQMGFIYGWFQNFIPLSLDNWNWLSVASKAEQYVKERAPAFKKCLPITVTMLMDEPAFIPLKKDEELNARFLHWLRQKKLTPADLGVDSLETVNILQKNTFLPKRLATWFYQFQMEEQIAYWNNFAALFKKYYPEVLPTVNWCGGIYYSGDSYLDLWELYRQPGMEIAWGEDWYDGMPRASGVTAWYADLMRSQVKYRKIPTGTYPIVAYGHSPLENTMKYYERLMRGCSVFHLYPYSLYGSEASWFENPVFLRNLAHLHRDVAEVENIVTTGTVEPASVAIIYPNSCFLWDKSAFHDALSVYLAHLHSGIPVDILTEQDILDGYANSYRLLYLVAANHRPEVLEVLEDFVKKGGRLCVSSPDFRNQFDELLEGKEKLFGALQINRISNEDSGRFAYEFKHVKPLDTVEWNNKKVDIYCQKSLLTPVSDAEILARFSDGNPAIVKIKKEKGEIYLYGFSPGLSYVKADYGDNSGLATSLTQNDTARELTILPARDVPQIFTVNTPMVGGRIIRSKEGMLVGLVDYGIGKEGRMKSNLNPWEIEDCEKVKPYPVTVTVVCEQKPRKVYGVRCGDVQWKYEGNRLQVEVPLRVVEMLIVKP